MRAVDFRVIRQCRQLRQRASHLFGRAFEQSSAAASKQGIATEQPALFMHNIGNMTCGVSGHIEYGKLYVRLSDVDHIII